MAFGAIMGQTPLAETSPLDKIGLYQILGKGSGTWTPQQTGKYLVIVIGPGGDGGKGALSQASSIYAYGGAGGGSGGVAVFELEVNELIEFSYEITDSSAIWNKQVTCNSGKPGQNGATVTPQPTLTILGGKGGTVDASIPLLLKANGLKGTDSNYTYSGLLDSFNVGASLPIVLNFPFFNQNKTGILLGSVTNGTPFQERNNSGVLTKQSVTPLGGLIGCGGDGGVGVWNAQYSGISVIVSTPGKGGDGAIIIQYLGKD